MGSITNRLDENRGDFLLLLTTRFSVIEILMKKTKAIARYDEVESMIHLIRGQRVMLSFDLAALYGVEPKVLNQAVKRNIERFPDDFLFQLTESEYKILRSQIVTSSWGGARRAFPYAFTEEGVAMLSSVLRSKRAIIVNIHIMRAFVRLREILSSHRELARKFNELENKVSAHDDEIKALFDVIRQLMRVPDKTKRQIGFRKEN